MPAFRTGADRFLRTAFMAYTASTAMDDSGSFIEDNVGRNVKRNLARPIILVEPG